MTWTALEEGAPAIAGAGRRLFGPAGQAIAFLATVRGDGGPRVHPVMPVVTAGGLYVFVVNLGWKYRDLLRDGRYALHSAPTAEGGEEFYVTGRATEVDDAPTRSAVRQATGNRLGSHEFEALFEFTIDRALYTHWQGWGTEAAWPAFEKWAAVPASAGESA